MLTNDMKFVFDKDDNCHSIILSLVFKIGCLNETDANAGITNLCEHMFFRNLNGIANNKIYQKMAAIGALEATTFREFVRFYITVTPSSLSEAADFLSQILYHFDWNDEDLQYAKAAVIKKIQNTSLSYDQFVNKYYFGNDKFTRSVLGTVESVSQITLSQVNEYKNKYFTPNNCCLVVTGPVTKQQENEIIKKFESINVYGNSFVSNVIVPKNIYCRTSKDLHIVPCSDNDSDIQISFDVNTSVVSLCSLCIINEIVGANVYSRLPLEMVNNKFLTDSVYSEFDLFNSFARLRINYCVDCANIAKSLDVVMNELNNIKTCVLKDELTAAKLNLTKKLLVAKDNNEENNFNIGWFFYINGFDFSVDRLIEKINLESEQELISASNRIFTANNVSAVIYNNSKKVRRRDIIDAMRSFSNGLL